MGSNESEPVLNDSETELSIQGEKLELIPHNIPPDHPIKTILAAHNKLSMIPQMLLHLEYLDISYNELGKTCTFKAVLDYPELKNLCISGNALTKFPSDIKMFKKLTDFVADRNKFTENEEIFKFLPNLENADLTLNFYKIVPEFPDSIISINFSFNFIRNIQKMILPNLRELRLSGNEISSISDECRFPNLKILDLSMNALKTIPPISVFAPTLETLLVPFNILNVFPTSLPVSLVKLDVSNNRISEFLTPLNENINLTTLDISNNKITSLPCLPPTLEMFNAENNQINTSEELKFEKLPTLQFTRNCLKTIPALTGCNATTLDFAHNKLEAIEVEKIGVFSTRLDFSCNLIKEIPEQLFLVEKLQSINITGNSITRIPESIVNTTLTALYISENDISTLPKMPVSLMTLKAIKCSFTQLPESLNELTRLNYIDFSNNKIKTVKEFPKCRHIGLSCNQITAIPAIPDCVAFLDISHNKMKELKIKGEFMMLQELDISCNMIEVFQFENLQICNTLKLSNNPLGKFSLNFAKLPSLKFVEATNTKLKLPSKIPDSLRELVTSNESFFTKAKTSRVRLMNPKKAAYSNTIGIRPTMEDSMIIREDLPSKCDIYSVIDGHGGADTASIAAYLIPQYFNAEKKKSISCFIDIINRIQDKIKKSNIRSGATISFAIVTKNEISCAYLGDTRAMIINRDGRIIQLSYDHKPTEPSEVSIIKGNRSYVSDKRTAGVLAISRALGDVNIEGVSHIPDMTVHFRKPSDYRLVIACDGVFDVLTKEEVSQIICEIPDTSIAAATIRNIALSRLSQDNVSVIVVNIECN